MSSFLACCPIEPLTDEDARDTLSWIGAAWTAQADELVPGTPISISSAGQRGRRPPLSSSDHGQGLESCQFTQAGPTGQCEEFGIARIAPRTHGR